MCKIGVVTLAVAACLSVGVSPASAADGSGSGSLGSVDVLVGGRPTTQPPIAPCMVGGGSRSVSPGVRVGEIAEYGRGETRCTSDPATGRATVELAGERFRLDALAAHGGPRIRLLGYRADCATTATGSSWRMQLTGLSGITVPPNIPANHTVMIPGRHQGDRPMAKVIINETVTPSPPDGSVRLNLMRVVFWPEGGGPISGDVVVGSVHCDPFGW